MQPADYGQWLEPKYRDGVADLIRQTEEFQTFGFRPARDAATLALVDSRHAIEAGGHEGLWDPARRMQELEAEGFVAQVIFPGDPRSIGMYYSNLNHPCSAQYRAAGARAHNRWLAEFCSYAPGRMIGVAQMEPWPDMDACVKEIHWAKKAGLGVVALPRFPGIEANQPPLTSPVWEPFWQACVETGMPASIHIGHGTVQGEILSTLAVRDKDAGFIDSPQIAPDAGPRRPLWQLIFSGVFDRHPELMVTFTEIRCEWVPPTLAQLERRFDEIRFSDHGAALPKLRPTDYWRRNCGLGHQLRPYDISLRHQIGVEQMMFGSDYPHPEGSWPNTREWLRVSLDGVSEDEARLIVGGNAARIHGLDTAMLAKHAERVGPEVSDLLSGGAVPDALVRNFHWRGGFLSRAHRYDPAPIEAVLDEDLQALSLA